MLHFKNTVFSKLLLIVVYSFFVVASTKLNTLSIKALLSIGEY